MGEERREPTAEEVAEQIRQIDVADLLLSTVSTLGQLAYVKLGANDREQARLAIDGLAALLPPLEGRADEQLLRDLRQLLANVRLAFVSAGAEAAEGDAPAPEGAKPEPSPEAAEPEPEAPDAEAGATPEPEAAEDTSTPAEPASEADGER